MLVDKILEYYEINPAAYPEVDDRWIAASAQIFVSSFIYFPIAFAILPLIYLFIKRNAYKKNKKQYIAKIMLYPLAGAIVGIGVLALILGVIASMGAKSFYEG